MVDIYGKCRYIYAWILWDIASNSRKKHPWKLILYIHPEKVDASKTRHNLAKKHTVKKSSSPMAKIRHVTNNFLYSNMISWLKKGSMQNKYGKINPWVSWKQHPQPHVRSPISEKGTGLHRSRRTFGKMGPRSLHGVLYVVFVSKRLSGTWCKTEIFSPSLQLFWGVFLIILRYLPTKMMVIPTNFYLQAWCNEMLFVLGGVNPLCDQKTSGVK